MPAVKEDKHTHMADDIVWCVFQIDSLCQWQFMTNYLMIINCHQAIVVSQIGHPVVSCSLSLVEIHSSTGSVNNKMVVNWLVLQRFQVANKPKAPVWLRNHQGTRTGHNPPGLWPGWNRSAVPFHGSYTLAELWLQISFWVLIVSWHDQYVYCAVLPALSPPAFRFAIRPIFVELLWNNARFYVIFAGFRQWLNEYWSDRQSESGRWKSRSNCTIYVSIMLRCDPNCDT